MSGSEEGPAGIEQGEAPWRRGPLATLAVLAVSFALVVTTLVGLAPRESPSPSPSPTTTPVAGVTASPSPPPITGDWSALRDLPPIEPAATLTPDRADRAGIAPDTTFTLASMTTVSGADLAAGLAIEPTVALRVLPGADWATVTVAPAQPLEPGTRYRFRLTGPDGALAGAWAFQVKGPLHVVTTLPADRSNGVPVSTGIELTFDQDGVIDAASHLSIEPQVEGRFETHGRTLVFVPGKLEPATLYTVTLQAGVGVAGSDVRLEQDVRLRFETGTAPASTKEPDVRFGRAVIEASPAEKPVIVIAVYSPEEGTPGTRIPVEIYRLPDADAALTAARLIADAPDWAQESSAGLVSTDGLRRVMAFEATVQPIDWGSRWFRLPDRLERGAYVLVIPREGRDRQALLQVTPIASYAAASSTRSLVWVNEIGGGPLAGVSATLAGGPRLGRTDARGLLAFDTPPALRTDVSALHLIVLDAPDGERVFVPLGVRPRASGYLSEIYGWGDPDPNAASYWSALSTDRTLYRQTDTVHLWGYLRERDSGRVPDDATVSLRLVDWYAVADLLDPAIASARVSPRSSGAFAAELPLADVPLGTYDVQLEVGGRIVESSWVAVDVIRKPAYELSVETDRHVLISGTGLRATVTARFYEGTVAPGVALSVGALDEAQTATTDSDGTVAVALTPRLGPEFEGYSSESVNARSTDAEEGDISAYAPILVFPSTSWLDATARLSGSELRLRGSVHEVDLARLERDHETVLEGDFDPKGDPIAGAQVSVEVVEDIPVRRLVGQRYDFIAKKVVDEYEVTVTRKPLGSRTVVSAADGTFSLDLAVPSAAHDYGITLRTDDAEGRTAKLTLYASAPGPGGELPWIERPYLELSRGCGFLPSKSYGIGDEMRLTMRDGYGTYPTGQGNAYLFFTAQRGLRDVVVQDSPVLVDTFTAADAPNLTVEAVRFTGATYYGGAALTAAFTKEGRELTVRLSADAARYRPGGVATITVRTTDRSGRPTPATVTLRAVDEKLFTIGGAVEEDPLGQLYEWVTDGLFASYASHPVPWSAFGDGCGDVTGGGRDDFRDTLLYRQLETGPDGVGTVTFRLSDDLTSWHVSAAAVTAGLEAGVGSLLVPVGLPFFVEPTLGPEFLAGDRPILRLRAFGSDLRTGDPVTFTVASTTLGMPETIASGRAFEAVDVPLPPLTVGEHALVISGTSGSGATALSDRLTRRFSVVAARLTRAETRFTTLGAGAVPEGGDGLTTYVFSDAGRGRYLPVLEGLAWDDGARLDQALAAAEARDLLVEIFGRDPTAYPDQTFDPNRYQQGGHGIALLPYASPDLDLTVRTILAAPDRFDVTDLQGTMQEVLADAEATRERQIQALAGSAALGDEVLGQVRTAAALTDLTVRERLYLALAAVALGDGSTAADLERGLLAEHGQRLGPWVRLQVGDTLDETVVATALWALVAVEVGDPLADEAEAYVEANPMADDLTNLQRLAFTVRALERTPSAPARFAYTVGGERTVVELPVGGSRALTLTAPQRRTLRLEPLAGEVGVATSWQVPLDPATVTPDPNLTLIRRVTPAGPVAPGQLVTVDLSIRFGTQALKGCTDVADLAPSGLAPVASLAGWPGEDETPSGVLWPYLIAGQRVAFCATPDPRRTEIRMRYYGRVVTPGTFAWEPATAQSTIAAESLTLTPATTIELR